VAEQLVGGGGVASINVVTGQAGGAGVTNAGGGGGGFTAVGGAGNGGTTVGGVGGAGYDVSAFISGSALVKAGGGGGQGIVAVAVQAIRAQQAAAELFTSEWKFNHGCTIFCTTRRQQHCYNVHVVTAEFMAANPERYPGVGLKHFLIQTTKLMQALVTHITKQHKIL
jgi:hypothetical protein